MYCTAVYFVITSFSSIGYGDIKAYSTDEKQFIILLEMVGIGFYGYMLGTIQKLFLAIQTKDQKTEFDGNLDNWLIKLG